MRSLLDASVLIAFIDTEHNFHEVALEWFLGNAREGWATCPIVENAVLRILTNPNYSKLRQYNLEGLLGILRNNIRATDHKFWPDDISLLDEGIIVRDRILGHKQLTDVYLLALAIKNKGRLVTFDTRIAINSVEGAGDEHLCVL